MTNVLLDEALRLANLGYRVFPLCPNSKSPWRNSHGCKDATADKAKIESWWTSTPKANIGIACGDGLLALDIDPGAIEANPERIAQLELDWAGKPRSQTPRKGFHFYMQAPTGFVFRNWVGAIGKGIDIRTDGGYVVAPPSRVVDPAKEIDGDYEWIDRLECPVEELPACPDWLAKALKKSSRMSLKRRIHLNKIEIEVPHDPHLAAQELSRVFDADFITNLIAELDKRLNGSAVDREVVEPVEASPETIERAKAYLAKTPPAVQGDGGHNALLRASSVLVRGFRLTDDAAYDLLVNDYNPRCRPRWEGAELERDFRHKIADARRLPFDKPVGWLLDPEHAYGGGMTNAEVETFTGRSPSEDGSSVRAELAQCTSSDSQQSHASLSAVDSENSQTGSQLGTFQAGAEEKPRAGAPDIVRMSDVPPEKVRWLWPNRIPLGKLTITAGDPGLGKSYMVLDLIARVSSGFGWPDLPYSDAPLGGAVILTCEDGLADTIRPRLDTLKADCTKIIAMRGVHRGDGKVDHFTLDDIEPLRRAIESVEDCKIVMIDAISGYLGNADSHNNAETRAVLADLATLAEETGAAIIGVSHLSKSGVHIKRSAYRVMGSLAFVAAPRAVWAVGVDPADDDRRIVANVKMNICKPAPSWAYRIDDAGLHWENAECELDCDTVLNGGEAGGQGHPAQDDAETFLLAELADGPVPVKELFDRAKDAGHTESTLRKAKKKLSVEAVKNGMDGGWVWADTAAEISRHVEGDPDHVQGAPV